MRVCVRVYILAIQTLRTEPFAHKGMFRKASLKCVLIPQTQLPTNHAQRVTELLSWAFSVVRNRDYVVTDQSVMTLEPRSIQAKLRPGSQVSALIVRASRTIYM